MKLTFYGHATFLIEAGGKKILFDPFFTGNPAAKDVNLDSITADYIFVTHGHGDGGTYAGNPMGFVFNTAEGDFYVAGDTALTMDMQLVPLWAKLTFSVLPIGNNFTMDVQDVIHASDFVKCNTVVGVHYNTYPPISIDTKKAAADFAAAGKTLLLPAVGETIEL